MSIGMILVIVLIVVLLGGLGGPWNYRAPFYGGGYPLGGILGLVLVVILILYLLGRI